MTRAVLITGAGSGIGRSAARALKARGWRVLAAPRREADVAGLAAEGFDAYPLDHEDPDSVAAGAARALEITDGRIDAVIHNGAFALPAPLEDVSREAMATVLAANLLGPHDLQRRLMPAMRAAGGGRIVAVSSVFGLLSLRYRGPYNISKYALEAWADALRRELGAEERPGGDWSVSVVEPGPVRTPFRERSLARLRDFVDPEASAWRRAWDEKIMPRLTAADPPRLAWYERTTAATDHALIHALESRRPRARYLVTPAAWMVAGAVRALPTRALDRLFRGDV
ncbi:MAG TPA: SDR family NAD(P)-dependent oxidoreductase [Paracoccaceae bacterium]|nr:SDR family NAD(P)-dependent oxidoreductase [Paracoccaceae bacterium]